VTTVFVTHDQEEALELADEVVVMNQAKVEQVGAPQEVYDRPASPFVIEFLGNVNRLERGRTAAKSVVYVRPHDIDIRREFAGEHAVPARVLHVFSAGNYGRVSLSRGDTGDTIEAELPRQQLRELNLHDGDRVNLVFRHVRLFPAEGFREEDLPSEPSATRDAGSGI
jgi:sulfate transport system ATP-binding protein